jgi:tetratricopeptide (TPR) repeat protein
MGGGKTWALERHYREGLQLLKQRHFPLATEKFRQALKSEADNAEIWFALGVSLYQQQDLLGAYQAYKAGLRLLPEIALQARLRSGLGDIYFEQQDFSQAIPAYIQALEHQPGWSGVRLKLATALLREQRFEEALFHSEQLQQESLPPAESLYLQSLIYLAQQNIEAAIPALEKLALYPEHAFNARQMLIWLYQKNHEAAYQENKTALKQLAKDYPEVYRVIGFSESQRYFDCYLKAAQACASTDYLATLQNWQLSGINTDSAYQALGVYYQLNHQWEKAEFAFARAYQIFPEHTAYSLHSWHMKQAQKKVNTAPPWQQLSFASEEPYPWRNLSVWAEEQRPIPLLPSLEKVTGQGMEGFWYGFFQAPWYEPPALEVQKLWTHTEKEIKDGAEKKIIQAWRLWMAGEKKWALASLSSAQREAPEWWLPYGLWSFFASQSTDIPLEEKRRNIEIAYRLNPIALKLAELRFYLPLEPALERARLKEVLTTFPDHEPFQYRYLQLLQSSD